ncbi:MAG: serine/threonine protein kinase, partial [Kiritimatiellae bacterium]|nr:serine/threonine protein kinase [Kiritimatiellia bacterium]
MDDLSILPSRRGEGFLAKIDQYELIRELGGGGFGTVYLAKDTVSKVDYAGKGLPPEVKNSLEELEGIRANFRLVSRLTHSHIARAYALHPAREVLYEEESVRQKPRVMPGDTLLVMEYAPGVTLSRWRRQFPGGRVPLPQALEIARQVASALDYAHEQKIIHRDVKPSNVVVETRPDGRLAARVLDFGLAAEIRSSMGRVSREVRDTSGARPYMAPEQWLGGPQGAATDQYALAVLVHELLTGAVPFASVFETNDPAVMMNAVTTLPPAIPGDLPRHVRAALSKALAKKPGDRFA